MLLRISQPSLLTASVSSLLAAVYLSCPGSRAEPSDSAFWCRPLDEMAKSVHVRARYLFSSLSLLISLRSSVKGNLHPFAPRRKKKHLFLFPSVTGQRPAAAARIFLASVSVVLEREKKARFIDRHAI